MSGLISPLSLAYEKEYSRAMDEIIIPYNSARRSDSTFDSFDGKPLFMSEYTADDPRAGIVIVHGYTESAEKYQELVYSFLNHGFNVYAYDARGHGRSWRDERLGNDKTLTHIDRFEDYVSDLRFVYEKRVPHGLPLFLFCHSMGGAVGAMYLEKYGTSCGFEKAVLSSPMIAPDRGGYPLFLAKGLCCASILLGKKLKRSLNSSPYPGHEEFSGSPASSEERFDWYEKIKSSTPVFQNYCSTYGLTSEFLGVTKKLLGKGKPESIAVPVMIFQAENDGSVINEYQDKFAGRVSGCGLIKINGAKHEIWRSTDDILFPYWEKVLDFIS